MADCANSDERRKLTYNFSIVARNDDLDSGDNSIENIRANQYRNGSTLELRRSQRIKDNKGNALTGKLRRSHRIKNTEEKEPIHLNRLLYIQTIIGRAVGKSPEELKEPQRPFKRRAHISLDGASTEKVAGSTEGSNEKETKENISLNAQTKSLNFNESSVCQEFSGFVLRHFLGLKKHSFGLLF
ncbi:uncharacterized protein LOC123011413 [Tribolium madens]|uniref:uncharacterized protein LOC123011413 n=1 Tax=Tribolium madens TaxID=41895 RepID=UPI001CF7265D|nr:uncharacterized protein LOC123011413 [Tribolium madens]